MRFTFEQIAIVGIAIYVLNKYLDYKVETWMEYYLHRKQQMLQRTEHFSSLSPAQNHNTRFYSTDDMEARDKLSCLPRGPYTQHLEPLYNNTPGGGVATNQMLPLQDSLQSWQATSSMVAPMNVRNASAMEPERAVCIGQAFQPITSPNVPYTTSLRPIEESTNTVRPSFAPLSADGYPCGMSGGVHETALLSSEQMTARSRRRDGEIYRYMQELDDPYGPNPAEALTPFTKQWTA